MKTALITGANKASDWTRSVEEGADTIVWLASEAPHELTGKFLRDRAEIPW